MLHVRRALLSRYMDSVQWYSSYWLFVLFINVLCRRILTFSQWTQKFHFATECSGWTSWLKHETLNFFPQSPAFNLAFLSAVGISNVLAMFLFPDSSLSDTLSDRLGPLLLVNINILFLLSFRHSVFIELAAAYQPEFLWAHQTLGLVTIAQVTAYLGLKFRGTS